MWQQSKNHHYLQTQRKTSNILPCFIVESVHFPTSPPWSPSGVWTQGGSFWNRIGVWSRSCQDLGNEIQKPIIVLSLGFQRIGDIWLESKRVVFGAKAFYGNPFPINEKLCKVPFDKWNTQGTGLLPLEEFPQWVRILTIHFDFVVQIKSGAKVLRRKLFDFIRGPRFLVSKLITRKSHHSKSGVSVLAVQSL